jgi:tight adherence protein B
MEILIGAGIFFSVALLVSAAFSGVLAYRNTESRIIKKRLRTLSAGGTDLLEIDIVRKRILSEVPLLNSILLKMTRIHELDRLVEQSASRMPLGFFVLVSLFLGALGFAGGVLMKMNHLAVILMAFLLGSMPLLYLMYLKKKRMAKFQEQLPDALDLVARALKAGHAFQGGLKMVAEEFGDPVGSEFAKTLDEINYGIGVDQAMKNLANRVTCSDLQFFVVSVIIQRETGGNLAEILEKIAFLIRERFKLHGKVRSLAAEGKLSAIILLALPPLLAFYFLIVKPEYIGLLFMDPLGIMMFAVAVILMAAGTMVMKSMVDIRV